MRMTGYGTFDWEASGYWAGIPGGWVPTVQVNPNILYRAGTTPTFGPSQIGEMVIPVEFGYRGTLSFEDAMARLVKRLQPTDPTPRELRGVRNDGTAIKTLAVLMIPAQSGTEINTFTMSFVAVDAYWTAATVTAQSVTLAGG